MSSEKDTFKNLSNEKPKTMDFSLQSNADKAARYESDAGKAFRGKGC